MSTIAKRSLRAAGRVGADLCRRRLYPQATLVFERLVAAGPQSATAWANLAATCQAAGQLPRARECAERAAALDPLNEFIRGSCQGLLKDQPQK